MFVRETVLKKAFTLVIAFIFLFTETVGAVQMVCYMPNGPIRSTPQYNPQTGYCETWPLDEYNTCPERYIYSQTLGTCVDLPRCTGNYAYDLGTKACVPIGNQTQEGSSTNGTTQYDQICAVDKNGDGDISEDELAECITADDGSKICPLDAAPCQAKYTVPDCPSGYTYDSQRKSCISNPTCIPGFVYDGYRQICTQGVSCPSGGRVQNVNGQFKCVIGAIDYCPNGQLQYQNGQPICVVGISCPSGGSPQYVNGQLKCAAAASLGTSCPSGFTYNSGRNVCETSPTLTPVCPALEADTRDDLLPGYPKVYDVFTAQPRYPILQEGCNHYSCYVWRCAEDIVEPCGGHCEISTHCENPITFYNVCVIHRQESFVPAWSTEKYCSDHYYIETPKYTTTCSQGTYNSQTGMCEISPSISVSCPPGYIYDPNSNLCTANVACPSGFSYDSSLQACKTQASKTCPSGYSYDSSIQLCVTSISCPSGSTFDSNLQACVAPPSCISGGSFNQNIGKCEGSASCPTGATLTNDGCFMGYFCPYGNYPCKPVNGVMQCSASQCMTTSEAQALEEDDPDEPSDYKDDSQTDPSSGQCLGQIYIFNGEKQRCRPSGWKTGFRNCCSSRLAKGRIYDSTGSTGGNFALLKAASDAIKYSYDIVHFGYWFATGTTHVYVGESVIILSKSADFANPWVIDKASTEWKALQNLFRDKGISPSPGTFIDFIGGDRTAATAMKGYVEALGPHIAWSITHLAISGLIKDPQVAALVNLAADAAAYAFYSMGWISTSLVSPIGLAAAVIGVIASFLFGGGCNKEDIITVTKRESGRCHYVGKRCIKKIRIGPVKKCIQKAKYYCCFNSKLARIIHEQGRPQLITDIRSWGSAKRPNCRGFTPEEFASLDFDKIDLSEYFEDITRNIPNNIETNVQKFFYDSIQTRISR